MKEVCKRCVLKKDLASIEKQLHEVIYKIQHSLDDELPDLEMTQAELLVEMYYLARALKQNITEEFGDE